MKTACSAILILALAITTANAQKPKATPGFNQSIPEKIMTPNKADTHFGTLEFVDGVPTEETTRRLYDNLDYMRGVEVFLNFIPAASLEGLRLGAIEYGATKSNHALLFDQLMGSNPLYGQHRHGVLLCVP